MIPSLSPDELKARLDRGDPLVLLDVREPAERALAAIPAGPTAADLHWPCSSFHAHFDPAAIDRDEVPLVVYCHHGGRSRAVIEWLERQGYAHALNLDGGIDAYARDVDPAVPRYA